MNIPKTQTEIHFSAYVRLKRIGLASAVILAIVGPALLVLASWAQSPMDGSFYFSLSEQNIRLLNTVGLQLSITSLFIFAILTKYTRRSEERIPLRLERYDALSERDNKLDERYEAFNSAQVVLQEDWHTRNRVIELKPLKEGEICSS